MSEKPKSLFQDKEFLALLSNGNVSTLIYEAFRDSDFQHRPRTPEKAAWLREQGMDPDKAFASA